MSLRKEVNSSFDRAWTDLTSIRQGLSSLREDNEDRFEELYRYLNVKRIATEQPPHSYPAWTCELIKDTE